MASRPDALMHGATDANAAGERYAARHAELAAAAGVAFARLTPTSGADWNDVLRRGTTGGCERRWTGGRCADRTGIPSRVHRGQ